MQISRKGESLWFEWIGEGFTLTSPLSVLYYTIEHVDIDHEVVRRALASAVQRDGLVDSLGQAYAILEEAHGTHGYAGELDGEMDLAVCRENGETYYGDIIEEPLPITWVEVAFNA